MRSSLRRSLSQASDLEELAVSKGVNIDHPFAGCSFASNRVLVLGPTEELYSQLLSEYLETQEQTIGTRASPSVRTAKAGTDVLMRVFESWDWETLSDECSTSPQNESSVVLLLQLADQCLLLTADAGPRSLDPVIALLEKVDLCPGGLHFVQVPHHGSRRNVGPDLLDRLLGTRQQRIITAPAHAVVSAAANGEPKHPSRRVTNAFQRRGFTVCATQGVALCKSRNAPSRPGWGLAEQIPFYNQVEETSDD
jgi:hypothetical protein